MLHTDKVKTNKKDKIGYYPPHDFCREFHKEKSNIISTFYAKYKDEYKYWNCKNEDNLVICFASNWSFCIAFILNITLTKRINC